MERERQASQLEKRGCMMKFVAGSEDGERAHEPANSCCQLEKEPDPLPEPPEGEQS